jgi:hypothetical protein
MNYTKIQNFEWGALPHLVLLGSAHEDRHHLSQVACARKRYDLDRVSFLLVS